MKSIVRGLTTLAASVLALSAMFGTAPGTIARQEADTEATAQVRIVHGIADSGPLDVYVDGALALFGIAFPDVGAALSVPAGELDVTIVPSGSDLDSAIAAGTLSLNSGGTYYVPLVGTVAAASVGRYAIDENPLEEGQARFRVVAGIADAGEVTPAFTGGDAISPALAFGDAAEYTVIDAGIYDLDILDAASGAPLLNLPQTEIQAGAATDILLVGSLADGSLQAVIANTSVAVTRPQGSTALILPGSCDRLATPGIDLGVVRPGEGEAVGNPDAPVMAQGYALAPVSFATLIGEPYAIVITGDDAAADVVACGDIGGWLTDTGALVVALTAIERGGPAGVAVLAQALEDPETTGVSVFLNPGRAARGVEGSPVPAS